LISKPTCNNTPAKLLLILTRLLHSLSSLPTIILREVPLQRYPRNHLVNGYSNIHISSRAKLLQHSNTAARATILTAAAAEHAISEAVHAAIP